MRRILLTTICSLALTSSVTWADNDGVNVNEACRSLPSYAALRTALIQARNQNNGGFNLDMWGTIVNRDGVVCAVAFTGSARGDQYCRGVWRRSSGLRPAGRSDGGWQNRRH